MLIFKNDISVWSIDSNFDSFATLPKDWFLSFSRRIFPFPSYHLERQLHIFLREYCFLWVFGKPGFRFVLLAPWLESFDIGRILAMKQKQDWCYVSFVCAQRLKISPWLSSTLFTPQWFLDCCSAWREELLLRFACVTGLLSICELFCEHDSRTLVERPPWISIFLQNCFFLHISR